MNEIILSGIIDDIETSHTIGDIQYEKANMIVLNSNGKQSILNIRFKKFSNTFKNGDNISITGNVRSYSHEVEGKNKVDLYVFTYFNEYPQDSENTITNSFEIDGRICSIKPMREVSSGKNNIQFILANNIIREETKLSSYLPCIAWGKLARTISGLKVNTPVKIKGELRSREYKKYISETEFELKVAHELLVTEITVLEESQLNVG